MINSVQLNEDQQARERILNDLETTLLVEAGAGSGKTTSLVGRMVNLVRVAGVPVEHIAAITFTKKAADELQTRFRMKLESASREATAHEERRRLEAATRDLNQCFIGTIHAFCGQLLRQRPIEAKLDPAFTELDELQSGECRNASWDAYLELLRTEGREGALEQLLALDVTVEDLRKVYHRVAQYEDIEIYREPAPRPDFDLIRLSLPEMIEEAFLYMPTTPVKGEWDGLQSMVRQARRMLNYLDMERDMDVLKLARTFESEIKVTQYKWTEKSTGKAMRDRFHDWQITVLQPFLRKWREYLHPLVIEFVLPAVAYGKQQRNDQAMVDFQDLLMNATALLREHPEVRRYFAARYTHLLVDEFQDTDPVQAEMMFLLTGEQTEERDWRVQTPRPGALFIVGDPKQSIYRFRRADISLYDAVKQKVNENGEVLRLTRNFRSVRAIGDYVNYAFESKFAGEESAAIQAPFVRMLTEQPNPKGKDALSGVHTLPIPHLGSHRQADIAAADAERIAAWIAWACEGGHLKIQERSEKGSFVMRPAKPGDFMILMKRKAFIHTYAAKLEQVGIPSDTTGSENVYEELLAITTLARCFEDPTEPTHLLAVLRGMLFGCSDDALYHYVKEAGAIRLYPVPEEEALSAKSLTVHQALTTLRRYTGWVRTHTAWTALASIIQDLGLIPISAVQPTGMLRSGTFVKLLQLVQAHPEAIASWSALTDYLGQILGTETLESTSLFAGAGNAVRIMNLHKAKGLEAPVVFMACPCGHREHDASEHVDRLSDPAQGYFTISRPKSAFQTEVLAQPRGWEAIADKERAFMLAEEDRLLYVAATRARQLLVVSQYLARPALDPWHSLGPTLEKQPVLEEQRVDPTRPEPLLAAPDIEGALTEWRSWLQQAALPTYEQVSVTSLTKSVGSTVLERPKEGRGMAFGTVVHRALEAAGNGLPSAQLGDFVRGVAEEEHLKEELIPEAISLLERVLASSIWQRALNAGQRLHEFAFMIASKETDGPDSILRGVIDLVFEEADGWVIVDFKTDLYEEQLQEDFVNFYAPQLRAYGDIWLQSTGLRVKELGLFFVEYDRYIPVVQL